jgi:hyperosmotically inducible protein
MNDVKQHLLRHNVARQRRVRTMLCLWALLASAGSGPLLAENGRPWVALSRPLSEQREALETGPAFALQNGPDLDQPPSRDAKPAQPGIHLSKNEETPSKEINRAEKEDMVRKTVSSLILTVKLALMADPRLFPYEIEVDTESHDVTLSGKVSTKTEKIAAAEIAGSVPTVKSVTNKLEVSETLAEILAHKQDDIITYQVKEQFAKSATVTAARFDVRTEQGVVSLSGTVRFQVIVLEAAEAARLIPGVKAVKTDKVKIESEG